MSVTKIKILHFHSTCSFKKPTGLLLTTLNDAVCLTAWGRCCWGWGARPPKVGGIIWHQLHHDETRGGGGAQRSNGGGAPVSDSSSGGESEPKGGGILLKELVKVWSMNLRGLAWEGINGGFARGRRRYCRHRVATHNQAGRRRWYNHALPWAKNATLWFSPFPNESMKVSSLADGLGWRWGHPLWSRNCLRRLAKVSKSPLQLHSRVALAMITDNRLWSSLCPF